VAVPNWRAGDEIGLGGRSLRVVDVRDQGGDERTVLVVEDQMTPMDEGTLPAIAYGAGGGAVSSRPVGGRVRVSAKRGDRGGPFGRAGIRR
jgi:hypothetical protein